jgi:uncharacterized protein
MRVVIDTTTLVTGMLGMNFVSPPRQVFDVWLRKKSFRLLTSENQLDEVKRTMQKPYFQERLSGSIIGTYINIIREDAEVISVTSLVEGVGTHPEDDKIVAIAIDGEADYLITSDKHLGQAIIEGSKIKMVTPKQFLYLIRWSL